MNNSRPHHSAAAAAPAEISGYVSTEDQNRAMLELASAMEFVATLAEGRCHDNGAEIQPAQVAPLLRVFAGFTRQNQSNLPFAYEIIPLKRN